MILLRMLMFCLLFWPNLGWAGTPPVVSPVPILLVLALIIGGAYLSRIVRKIKLPSVVGELVIGMLIALLAHYKISFWPEVINQPSLALFAEIGSILLLFEIGLESDLDSFTVVGKHGLGAALMGIIIPFGLGAVVVAALIFKSSDLKLSLFLGATLAATSTGISVRVFKDLGILANPACQIVLAASIIDDVLGLIILAIVSGLAVEGSLNLTNILGILLHVIIFFSLTLIVARKISPWLLSWIFKINNEESLVVAIMLASCLFWAWFAAEIGLAAIIGAFMAGIILDKVSFRQTQQPFWYQKLIDLSNSSHNEFTQPVIEEQIIAKHQQRRLVDLLQPLNYIFVPIFFVYAGMQIDLAIVANWQTLGLGLALSLAAIGGKLVCGVGLPKTINRWIVGWGMVPRGEIGLIFALTGRQLGVFNQTDFAAVMLMVIITSLLTPLALEFIIKRGGV